MNKPTFSCICQKSIRRNLHCSKNSTTHSANSTPFPFLLHKPNQTSPHFYYIHSNRILSSFHPKNKNSFQTQCILKNPQNPIPPPPPHSRKTPFLLQEKTPFWSQKGAMLQKSNLEWREQPQMSWPIKLPYRGLLKMERKGVGHVGGAAAEQAGSRR